jgi:hypothetical protein
VPRPDKLDAEAIERHREDSGVVTHESEHGADPQGMDVLGQDLEHRHDPTVVHIASFRDRWPGHCRGEYSLVCVDPHPGPILPDCHRSPIAIETFIDKTRSLTCWIF